MPFRCPEQNQLQPGVTLSLLLRALVSLIIHFGNVAIPGYTKLDKAFINDHWHRSHHVLVLEQ